MPPSPVPPSRWRLPAAGDAGADEIAGIGADLEPGTVLDAYRAGLFPMPLHGEVIGWWSPDPRGILPLDGLHVSRSLRASRRGFEIRIDTAFADVVRGCAAGSRPGGWISPAVESAYLRLHRLGWGHSVEAWSREDGGLAGGLYGLAVGGLFAAESMFHRRTDAGKAALCALVDLLAGEPAAGRRLLDVQWRTDHLATLGVVAIPRAEYLRRLEAALELPLPRLWG